MDISPSLKAAYDEQYSDDMTEWRELGGKYKADNMMYVCGYNFSKVLECGAGDGGILKFLDSHDRFDELYAIEISRRGISRKKKRSTQIERSKDFQRLRNPRPRQLL